MTTFYKKSSIQNDMAVEVTDDSIATADNVAAYFWRHYHCRPMGDLCDVKQYARLILVRFFSTCNIAPSKSLLICHIMRRLIDELRRATHYNASKRPEITTSSEDVEIHAFTTSSTLNQVIVNDLLKVLSDKLTSKEKVVLWLLARGLSQADIARRLCVYRSTICRRVLSIREKYFALN